MNPRKDELIRLWLDGAIAEADAAELLAEMGRDPALLREVRRHYRVHRLLGAQHDLDLFGEQLARSIAALRDEHGAERLAERVTLGIRDEADAQKRTDPARDRRLWRPLLALAASLAIVAGGWWSVHNSEPAQTTTHQPAPTEPGVTEMGLRVTAVVGEAVIGARDAGVRHPASSNGVPVVVGRQIHQGEWIVIKSGGKVGLKYEGEATTIDLYSAVAVFSAERGAKRVTLDSGLLLCTAAPQAKPFRLQTPQGVATVVGTRFTLDAGKHDTTLAVREGTVALSQGTTNLEVKAGETAVTDKEKLRKLSDEDAWLRELRIRAVMGSWDAINFKDASTRDPTNSTWFVEDREGAERRIWHTGSQGVGVLLLDTNRWTRGVVVGRMMLLPDGEQPAELAITPTATVVPHVGPKMLWTRAYEEKVPVCGLVFHNSGKNSNHISLSDGAMLSANVCQRGVWNRFAVYFELIPSEGLVRLVSIWPQDSDMPPAAQWDREWNRARNPSDNPLFDMTAASLGIGLMAHKTAALWQGVQFVPLGEDMPPMPQGLKNTGKDQP